MINAIVFDFDGLIIDTEQADYDSWRLVYERRGQVLPFDQFLRNVGTHSTFDEVAHLQELTGETLDRHKIEEEQRQLHLELINGLPLMPGVMARIEEAKSLGLKLGVASSSPTRWLNYHLPRRGLLFEFQAVRGNTDVGGRQKPDPAVYLSALDGLGVEPQHALAFEDSAHGVRAAKAAGMTAIAVPNNITRSLDFSHADDVIASLDQITLQELIAKY